MKPIARIGVAALCLLLHAAASPAQFFIPWDFHNIADDVQQSGAKPDFVIDDSGVLHITMWNSFEDKLMYGSVPATGGSINWEYVDAATPGGFRSAVAVDQNGAACVAWFANISGKNEVRFARRSGGVWTTENLPTESLRGWGEYGNSASNMTENVRQSIDLAFGPGNAPVIYFFNPWYDPTIGGTCGGYYQFYEFRMVKMWKDISGWRYYRLPKFPDITNSCGGTIPAPVPDGDRFGEHCQVFTGIPGKEFTTTNAYQNNQVLLYEVNAGDTQQTVRVIDSLGGLFPCFPQGTCCNFPNAPSLIFWYTLESVSADQDRRGSIHMAYSTSVIYGNDPDPSFWSKINSLGYSRYDTNGTVYHYAFSPNTCSPKPYHALTSTAVRGTDSVYILFVDKTNSLHIMAQSFDAGITWTTDTLPYVLPQDFPVLKIRQDTLHALIFDPDAEELVWMKRHVDGGAWSRKHISTTNLSATCMDAGVWVIAGDTTVWAAYNDFYSHELHFATGIQNGSYSWTFEHPDTANTDYAAIQVMKSAANEPVIVYARKGLGELMLAYRQGTNWVRHVIATQVNVAHASAQLTAGDTLRLAWQDQGTGTPYYTTGHISGGAWVTHAIDTAGLNGDYISLALGAGNRPSVAYHNRIQNALVYAHYTDSAGWVNEIVDRDTLTQRGTHSEIRMDNSGRPVIVYRDELTNLLYLAEWQSPGTWALSTLDSSRAQNVGSPSRLQVDVNGNYWIAYSYSQGFDRIKLLKKDLTGWHSISVSTTGWISNSFAFEILGQDLFICGKKNQPGNNGVALLKANNALSVDISESQPAREPIFETWPNPFRDELSVMWETASDAPAFLHVRDCYGRSIAVPGAGTTRAGGIQRITFSTQAWAQGVYFLTLECGGREYTRKLVRLP